MGEKNRFQQDVEVVSQALARRAGREDAMEEGRKLYRKFTETKQEPVRLAVALRGFFLEEGVDEESRETFGNYLKGRIRPAVEQLIEEDAVEKIQQLEELGWFGQQHLEGFIKIARERKKSAALVWFLHLKQEKYQYEDKDFSL